jgi:hypothetical protein
MPFKGKPRVTTKQKAVMAAAKLTGKTSRQVASDVGLHPDTVRRHWGLDESLNLQLKRQNADTIRTIYREGLKCTLRLIRQRKDGRLALAAVKVGLDYATAGDPPLERVVPPPPPAPTDGPIRVTLEELLIVYRRASQGTAEGPAKP